MSSTTTGRRGLRLLPIIVGSVVDVVGTLLGSVLLAIVVTVLSGPEVFNDQPTAPIVAGWIFFGCTFTLLGGFVAGLMAKQREVMHGLGVAIVGGAIGLWSDPSGLPRWFLLAAIVAGLLAGALGGALARWVRGAEAAPQEGSPEPSVAVTDARGRRRLALAVGVAGFLALGAIGIGLSRPAAQPQIAHVYLVPIHAAPELLTQLKDYYREQLHLEIELLPAVQADSASFDSGRQQLIAEELVEILRDRFGELTKNRGAIVIGVTSWDMYPRSRPWQFSFGWRSPPYAVVSYARMHLTEDGPSDETLVFRRLRKMVTRYVGMMAFGIALSPDRHSVMYQDIMGLDDLDRIDENLADAGFPAR